MIYLLDFSVIKPDFGQFFWTVVIFLIFWLLIGKFAFRPIADALKARASGIQDALDQAKKAKQEMQALNADNEKLLASARTERANIVKDAKDIANGMIDEAKQKAKEEANKIIESSRLEIENQKNEALKEVKNEVASIALDIAEKLIHKELKKDDAQKEYANNLVSKMNLN